MRVVKATNSIDDIEGLKEVALEWRDTCNGKDFYIDLDPETYFRHLAEMIEDEDSELFLLLKKDRVIGYMGVICFNSPFGRQTFSNEHFWFVSGKNRGRGALMLFKAIEKWGKEKGCSHQMMNASALASNMHDRLCRFYERMGYRKFETSYIKELK